MRAAVKFRTIPPDPREFPRLRLVLPVFVPLALVFVGWAASESGHQWNIHGDGALILAAIFGTGIAAFLVTLIALVRSIGALSEHESLRSSLNLGCTWFAGLVLLLSIFGVVYAITTAHAT
jgi:hypothetical protein